MFDVSTVKKEFPIFSTLSSGDELVYLDSAATAHKPKRVIDALSSFYATEYGTVHRAIYDLAAHATEKYNKTRERAAIFLHAKTPDEIVFTKGTTDGLNLIARSYGEIAVFEKDEIIISEIEHHSNIVPWQMLCERKKALLKIIPVNDKGEIVFEEFLRLLSPKTKIVSVAHIANSTGTMHPVKEIIQEAHKVGAKVVIDGAQAASHLPVDVQALDADFYVFSSHKIYGPNGVGILYGKKELLEKMGPIQGGGDMIEEVTFAKTTYQQPPLRFEAGTPAIAEIIALTEAFSFIERIGRDEIFLWEKFLLEKMTKKIQEIDGIRIIGTASQKGAILSFVAEKAHPLDIGTMLDLKGICVRTGHHCAQPAMKRFNVESTTRASFGVYNTREDVDFFIDSLKEVLQKIRQ